MKMSAREWLPIYTPDFYNGGIFKLLQKLDKRINVLGNYV
jgi:hypothetical protein